MRVSPVPWDCSWPRMKRSLVLGSAVSLFWGWGAFEGQRAERRLVPLSLRREADRFPRLSPGPAETQRARRNVPAPNARLFFVTSRSPWFSHLLAE